VPRALARARLAAVNTAVPVFVPQKQVVRAFPADPLQRALQGRLRSVLARREHARRELRVLRQHRAVVGELARRPQLLAWLFALLAPGPRPHCVLEHGQKPAVGCPLEVREHDDVAVGFPRVQAQPAADDLHRQTFALDATRNDNLVDARDVGALGEDEAVQEDRELAVLERLDRRVPRHLGHAARQEPRVNAVAPELVRERFYVGSAAAEDDGVPVLRAVAGPHIVNKRRARLKVPQKEVAR